MTRWDSAKFYLWYYRWAMRSRWIGLSMRLYRFRFRVMYGRVALARLMASVDQAVQPGREEFYRRCDELDAEWDRAFAEGRVSEPRKWNLRDFDWFRNVD